MVFLEIHRCKAVQICGKSFNGLGFWDVFNAIHMIFIDYRCRHEGKLPASGVRIGDASTHTSKGLRAARTRSTIKIPIRRTWHGRHQKASLATAAMRLYNMPSECRFPLTALRDTVRKAS